VTRRFLGLLLLPALGACSARAAEAEPGLLFYVSGERGTDVDFSRAGTKAAKIAARVSRIPDGARGAGLRCEHTQVLSWEAAGNLYGQRGTLSFFCRAREAVGPTEFPIFRVAFSDHSSWDMVFLRIDYNGHGFDAFVTDASLARTRVSVTVAPFPAPSRWTHLAVGWDETYGIRLWVDGKLAAVKEARARYDTGLDQLGPHSRIISPHNVQSDYNFVRGGDVDELRVYDRMLDDPAVAALARGEAPRGLAPLPARDLRDPRVRDEWWWRYGWNRADDAPPYTSGPSLSARKVEIHDAYDLGRWWWKANDGIRETTWPGVYNRSRLPGRSDYFTLLDWDCYSLSGRAVTFTLPDEPWNQIEISGAAWGKATLVDGDPLFERRQGQERTFHRLGGAIVGGKLRFENAEPERPIGELGAYLVTAAAPPTGRTEVRYRLGAPGPLGDDLRPLAAYIERRHQPDERALLVARPAGGKVAAAPGRFPRALPLVHVLVPRAPSDPDGLDGIALDLPAIDDPGHADVIPFNVQVKDPLWPARDLLDLSFSVKPGEGKRLWLDVRDRVLPAGKPLYLTLAAASDAFGAATLDGAELRAVYKPRAEARREHVADRFTEVRDAYAMLVEEHPADARFDLWNRFKGDLDDLLRVDPQHELGRLYAAAAVKGAPRPPFTQPAPPAGVPLWAFRQVTALEAVKRLVLWYVEHRQIADGELGGGLSDDTDLTNVWPGTALMGAEPDRIAASLRRVLEACYANGMLTHGLPTAQADELHGYEEGINALAQAMLVDHGNPLLLERAMETARGVAGLTGVNAAGHRHFRTSYYSATRVAEDSVWGTAKAHMTLLLHPVFLLGDYAGNPTVRKLVLELADGLLAHARPGEDGKLTLPPAIHFADDRESADSRDFFPWPLFWAAWKWSGDRKYLGPILDGGMTSVAAVSADMLDELGLRDEWRPRILGGERPGATEQRQPGDIRGRSAGNEHRRSSGEHFLWQLTGDKRHLEKLYADEIEEAALHEYINTEGSIWIDRVVIPHADLQRARLGGVALVRNAAYPGHVVSWRFEAPATEASAAILIPSATPTAFDVVAYNLDARPVRAALTTWNVDPGRWEVTRGLDTDGDDRPDRDLSTSTADLERGASLPVTLAPRATTVLRFRLKTPGVPYAARPDLGIGREDVSVGARAIKVRVHSLGAVATPAARLVFRDAAGRARASAAIPPLPAPLDLLPKTADVVLDLPAGVTAAGGSVAIEVDSKIPQVTSLNDVVRL